MTKKTQAFLTLAVAALPLSSFAVDMHGGLSIDPVTPVANLPAEASISILPTLPIRQIADGPVTAVAKAGAEAPIRVIPFPSKTFSLFSSASKPARADVQAMLAPREAIVPAGEDVSKMSGDQASGEGAAIMDRILYIKGTPASVSAVPVAGAESVQKAALKPARRGPIGYLLAGPVKLVRASTDYASKKTKISPFWTAFGFSALNIVATLKAMTTRSWDLPMPGTLSHGQVVAVLGFSLMALLYLGYGMAMDKAQTERDTVRKMNESAVKAQANLKSIPGVVGVEGETIPGEKANDHVIIVRVSQLDAANINKIPQAIDGFKVRVQFAR